MADKKPMDKAEKAAREEAAEIKQSQRNEKAYNAALTTDKGTEPAKRRVGTTGEWKQ